MAPLVLHSFFLEFLKLGIAAVSLKEILGHTIPAALAFLVYFAQRSNIVYICLISAV